MISYLKGKIKLTTSKFIILEINNLGYKVFLKEQFLEKLKKDQDLEIYTHQYVREDALDLYGFRDFEELQMFELLIFISGVGPKSALGILSLASLDQLNEAISRQDVSILTKVSGIGKKTAERVILELKNRLDIPQSKGKKLPTDEADEDIIDALVSLGYNVSIAREALRKLPSSLKSTQDKIRAALKIIGK